MTAEERMKVIEAEGLQAKIDDMFQALYQNIVDGYGGEDKISPFNLANIRGGLTRAKYFALKPAQETINGQKAADLAACPAVAAGTGFRV